MDLILLSPNAGFRLPIGPPRADTTETMAYVAPDVASSFAANDLGSTLYELVLKNKPNLILEFGTLYGYSTVAMALGLKDVYEQDGVGPGRVVSYDLWGEEYAAHNKGRRVDAPKANAEQYGVSDYITFLTGDFRNWQPEPFDMMFVDIANDGNTVKLIAEKTRDTRGLVYFEGGTEERDTCKWAVEWKKTPMRWCGINYEVIDARFPAISRLIHA